MHFSRLFKCIVICAVIALHTNDDLWAQNKPFGFTKNEVLDDGHLGFLLSLYLLAPSDGGDRDRDYNFSPGLDFDHQLSNRWGALGFEMKPNCIKTIK